MATQKRMNLLRRAYYKTRDAIKRSGKKLAFATVGIALGLAVAGCGKNRMIGVTTDSGMDSKPDVVQFDTVKPQDAGPAPDTVNKPDMGVDSQSPDSYIQADTGIDTFSPDTGVDSSPPDSTANPDSGITYSYTVKNLIGDFLNRELLDRDKGLTSYSLNTSETSQSANPLSDGTGGSLGPTYENITRISGAQFQPFASSVIMDDSSGRTYHEQQDFWFSGDSHYSEAVNDVVGRIDAVFYSLKFKGPADYFGIPVCDFHANQDYSACKSSTKEFDHATEMHKVKLKLLGEDWVITEMSPPSVFLDNETQVVPGGYIKLAKGTSKIINIYNDPNYPKKTIDFDNLKFAYDSYQVDASDPNLVWATIAVYDQNDVFITKDKLLPGTTLEFSIYGKNYKFHLWKIAPGIIPGANWIDASIFLHELKFQHNSAVDSGNKYWYAYLGWKNKGASLTDTKPDHLRTLILGTTDISNISSGQTNDLVVGDYIPILTNPSKLILSYNGLTNANFSVFQAELERNINFNIPATYGPMDSSGVRMACSIHAPYIKIKSSEAGAAFTVGNVQGASPQTNASGNTFFIATSGATCSTIGNLVKGALFMNASPGSGYWAYLDYAPSSTSEILIQFPAAGKGTVNPWGGYISYIDAKSLDPQAPHDFGFTVWERAGTGMSSDSGIKYSFGLKLDGANSTLNFDIPKAGGGYWQKKNHINYLAAGPLLLCFQAYAPCQFPEGYISEGGSEYVSMTDTLAEFKIAETVVFSLFRLDY